MQTFDISVVPVSPAVYLLKDFRGNNAYVGTSEKLRGRITQHFLRRDSSVTTGVSAAVLNVDQVHCVQWWLEPRFNDSAWREAAELVAFDVFQPTIRSLGGISTAAQVLYAQKDFQAATKALFAREPDGEWSPLNLQNLFRRLETLEAKVAALDAKVTKKSN